MSSTDTEHSSDISFDASALQTAISTVCLNDACHLENKWQQISARLAKGLPCDKLLKKFESALEQAQTRIAQRSNALPNISFDDALPISAKRDDIATALENHQVIVLAGETGSGKTTQIPKICLQQGRGIRGMVGHTQPRRIAARTVASRIAEELNVTLGGVVGYQVRFTDHSDDNTLIKLMTDGILLTDIQQDPLLLKYDTLIIDEAHERSLNIDFLLGYLKNLLPKRPDLKLVITSATIDLEKFSEHFNDAPIIEVSGRMYPVETVYRPWDVEHDDVTEAVVACIDEILRASGGKSGDILVFLSGEREIREASHAIKKAGFHQLEVLPLYARLSLAEQNRVFHTHAGRRVVLATNVAETSLTVPGIRYVIDPGYARISRYSVRTKVQRLPIEAISQASANQRKGRCGRVSEGVCYRLYDEEDFTTRPEFTDPEIQRTNLAAVILQMLQLRMGDVRKFPFVDRPENRLVNDGFKLLEELQAVNKKGQVTPLGKQIHSFPVDPRLSRIILEAAKRQCVREVLIIVSGLSLQDPRERPAEKRQAADEIHRRFWDEDSDFIAYIKLWDYLEEQRQALSQNQFRKLCGKEFINYMRTREWRDLHHQLRLAIKSLNIHENKQPADYEAIHRALLAGMLSNIGCRNEDRKSAQKNDKERGKKQIEYLGSRNRKFQIFPGSSQFKKKPQWLMAAEFIETSQLFSHTVAKIDPSWALDCGQHLLKYHYFEPHYDAFAGQVMAYARISLFGLNLVEKKRLSYSKVDRAEARAVFIREALVEGRYAKHKRVRRQLDEAEKQWQRQLEDHSPTQERAPHFFTYNQWLVQDIESLEAKARRKDILVDDQEVFNFYDERIPADITNLAGFEHWREIAERDKATLLMLDRERLMLHSAEDISEAQFPDQLESDGLTLPLYYHFEPGHPDDGVNVRVPVELLPVLPRGRLEWLVPGLLRDKCIAMVKGLPKSIRKKLVPVPDVVDRALARLSVSNRPLQAALSEILPQLAEVSLSDDDWTVDAIDDFYRMNIQVVDENGEVIDRDRDIDVLRDRYRQQVRESLQEVHHDIEKTDLTQWDFGELPKEVQMPHQGVQVKGFPALVEKQQSVDLQVLDNPLEARELTRRGVVRLAMLQLGQTGKYLRKELLRGKDLGLAVINLGRREQVIDDLISAAVARACFSDCADGVSDAGQFNQRIESGRAQIVEIAQEYEALLVELLKQVLDIRSNMKAKKSALALAFAFADINQQLDTLFAPGFLWRTPWEWLQHYPRYLNAIQIRLEKAPQNPRRDKQNIELLQQHWQRHRDLLERLGSARFAELQSWQAYRWMVEELRVSLFAQTLKTQFPVSDKRLKKQWETVLNDVG